MSSARMETDGQLLTAFVNEHDEAAFAIVMQRHGRTVLAVCRGILNNPQDAEDAAQAVFVTLAKTAETLVNNTSIARWLHHVAHCIAVNGLRSKMARRAREQKAAEMMESSVVAESAKDGLCAALTRELDALPRKYQEALILFHMEEQSQQQIAELLGCTPGNINMRLIRGREMLRKRLVRQGVALSVGSVAAMLTGSVQAAEMPAAFVATTTKAACLVAAGKTAAGVVSGNVLSLTKGALNMIFWTQVKTVAACVLMASMVGGTAVPVAMTVLAAEKSAPAKVETKSAASSAPMGNDSAPLGSPKFYPSPEHPIGWRGDGSGNYPAATPPLHWGREAKSVKELRGQAAKPKAGETGQPLQLGVISEWLALGPIPLPDDFPKDVAKAKDLIIPEAGTLKPSEGEELAGAKWKKVKVDSSVIHWSQIFGRDSRRKNPAAYALAHTYVYSPSGGPVMLQSQHCQCLQIFLNGSSIYTCGVWNRCRLPVNLTKGWNSILLKVVSTGKSGTIGDNNENWYSRLSFYGTSGAEYEDRNIAWSAEVPGGGAISSPIIVGDKILVTGEWCSLCCFNKADGKLLWVRSSTTYDAATDEEKKAHPEVFEEMSPLAAKLRQIDETLSTATPSKEDRLGVEKQIYALMAKVDAKKYDPISRTLFMRESGYAGPTPTSDGRRVYATFPTGVTACFDLDGNRKWASSIRYGNSEHGWVGSPKLAGDRLLLSVAFDFESVAFDKETGKELWHNRPARRSNMSIANNTSVVTASIGGETFFIEPWAGVARVSDGKCVFPGFVQGNCNLEAIPTPVIDKGLLCVVNPHAHLCPLRICQLPDSPAEPFQPKLLRDVVLDPFQFPRNDSGWYEASPLLHDGLLYCVNEDAVLSVVDPETGEIVYRRLLDADLYFYPHLFEGNQFGPGRGGMGSSPTLAGKYIYLFANQGACLVIEPGRTFKQISKNRIECIVDAGQDREHYEVMESCPVFEGHRLYYRAEKNLYCIEER